MGKEKDPKQMRKDPGLGKQRTYVKDQKEHPAHRVWHRMDPFDARG